MGLAHEFTIFPIGIYNLAERGIDIFDMHNIERTFRNFMGVLVACWCVIRRELE